MAQTDHANISTLRLKDGKRTAAYSGRQSRELCKPPQVWDCLPHSHGRANARVRQTLRQALAERESFMGQYREMERRSPDPLNLLFLLLVVFTGLSFYDKLSILGQIHTDNPYVLYLLCC